MNQSSGKNDPPWVDAKTACGLLGVKKQTLYAYVSRGVIRSTPSRQNPRTRMYSRGDLLRARSKSDARSGHGAVAAGAMQFGQPVLDSSITVIRQEGHAYRGHSAIELCQTASFETIAQLLWNDTLDRSPPVFDGSTFGLRSRDLRTMRTDKIIDRLSLVTLHLAAEDPQRHRLDPSIAPTLVRRLTAAVALAPGGIDPRTALAETTVARSLLIALGARPTKHSVRAVDRALVLCADHELNPSSFSARVTASAGGDLYACITAALATLSGPKHGGATERVEALIQEIGSPERAVSVLQQRLSRGEPVTGFDHPLYPKGDPRTGPLLADAKRIAGRRTAVRAVVALVDAAKTLGLGHPTVDIGLVALRRALGLPEGSAVGLFAIGRSAGWIAHALEQHSAGFLLRPRARYVGVV